MRKRIFWLLCALWVWLLTGCGGGGGFGGVVIQGRVALVGTGNPPNPPAIVRAAGATTQTDPQEGSFTLRVPPNTNQLTVEAPGYPTFTFTLPSLRTDQVNDLGVIYVGPQKVAVQGRIIHALEQSPVGGATVSLLGQRTSSNETDGKFTLNDVPFDPAGVLDPEGLVEKVGFVPQRFLVDVPPIDGIIQLGDIAIAPQSDDNPPNVPGNVRGTVQIAGENPIGTLVIIYSPPDAETPRETEVINNPSGQFALWLLPGQYRLVFSKTGRQAVRTVTVVNLNTPIDLGTVVLE